MSIHKLGHRVFEDEPQIGMGLPGNGTKLVDGVLPAVCKGSHVSPHTFKVGINQNAAPLGLAAP